MDRREFLRSTAAVGAGLAFSSFISGQAAGSEPDDINVALLGAGAQGQVLMNACRNIPGIRFKAVCDIWEKYNLKRTVRTLRAYKHEVNEYQDYRVDQEPGSTQQHDGAVFGIDLVVCC